MVLPFYNFVHKDPVILSSVAQQIGNIAYEFDMSTGDLNPNPIDYSIYGTYLNNYGIGSRTLPENVGTKNSTASSKAHLIEAYGAVGGSINEPFTLTVSTSSTYDSYETDENALHAYPFTVATGGSTLSSRHDFR